MPYDRMASSGREKSSVAIASNESFSGWTETFTDPRLCAAIVDRLTFGGDIIETGTDSRRLATTRARAEQQVASRSHAVGARQWAGAVSGETPGSKDPGSLGSMPE